MTTALAAASAPEELTLGVRTWDGRPLGQIACDETTDTTWSRQRSEVSVCEITTGDIDAGELVPWLHWIDVWEDAEPVWSGPIQEAGTDLATGRTSIEVRDVGTYQWYTRVPTTRSWSHLDPAPIAADLWRDMLALHSITADPTVLPAVTAERFSFSVTADSRMLHQVMGDLVRLGADWTVVAGRPIIGRPGDDPVAELDECDIMASLRRIRSGKRAVTDVRVQGQNWTHTERADIAGLHLQALISADNLFGAANITAAAREYLREVGALRDVLEVPSDASLAPDAPITTAGLIPGSVIVVHADELAARMRLKSVEVAWTGGSREVRVTLDAITTPIQLNPGGAL